MLLNEDVSVRTVVHAGQADWIPSPIKGVERRMLFRSGDEKARATSIVRYAPGSRFARHGHPGGEEFLVLEGTFQDETGDFPAGTYVRNPPGTAHSPGSDEGCVILVKLWQFRRDDRARIIARPDEAKRAAVRPGAHAARLLFDGADERVVIEHWTSGANVDVSNDTGLEVLVLEGGFAAGSETFLRWSWLRLPAGRPLRASVGPDGAQVWMRAGAHLHADVCAFESEGRIQ